MKALSRLGIPPLLALGLVSACGARTSINDARYEETTGGSDAASGGLRLAGGTIQESGGGAAGGATGGGDHGNPRVLDLAGPVDTLISRDNRIITAQRSYGAILVQELTLSGSPSEPVVITGYPPIRAPVLRQGNDETNLYLLHTRGSPDGSSRGAYATRLDENLKPIAEVELGVSGIVGDGTVLPDGTLSATVEVPILADDEPGPLWLAGWRGDDSDPGLLPLDCTRQDNLPFAILGSDSSGAVHFLDPTEGVRRRSAAGEWLPLVEGPLSPCEQCKNLVVSPSGAGYVVGYLADGPNPFIMFYDESGAFRKLWALEERIPLRALAYGPRLILISQIPGEPTLRVEEFDPVDDIISETSFSLGNRVFVDASVAQTARVDVLLGSITTGPDIPRGNVIVSVGPQ